ncbi:MAG: hypothetical protein JNL98_33000 [Bryobacterales bacterium]|nr:hypothetical protein [Bryobacterales bacterium]
MEKQKQLSHSSHRPLEISPTTRDSHIPTARLRARGKVDNLAVSHFPTAACDDGGSFFFSIPKPKKGTRPLQAILVILFQDQPPLETEPDFRIILGLENAQECG